MLFPSGSITQGICGFQLDGVAVMVFTLSQSLFLLLQGGDISDGNADSKDFSRLPDWLIGQHQSGRGLIRGGFSHLDTWKGLAAEGASEIWLELCEEFRRNHLRDLAAQMIVDAFPVHLRKSLVQIDVTQTRIDEGEAYSVRCRRWRATARDVL